MPSKTLIDILFDWYATGLYSLSATVDLAWPTTTVSVTRDLFGTAGVNRVLMTANLRSSQLVLRLAQLQKSAGMQIVRMTDWTDLSEVQQSEEALFTQAYDSIDAALT